MADQESKIPAIDDFGNPAALPGRVIERNAGCWNCRHYDPSSQVFKTRVNSCYARDLKFEEDRLLAQGVGLQSAKRTAKFKADRTRYILTQIPGMFGICEIKAVPGEFTAARELCRNPTRWDAADGASLARAPGEPLSPLIEEEYEKRGEPVPLSGTREAEPPPEPEPDIIEVIEVPPEEMSPPEVPPPAEDVPE